MDLPLNGAPPEGLGKPLGRCNLRPRPAAPLPPGPARRGGRFHQSAQSPVCWRLRKFRTKAGSTGVASAPPAAPPGGAPPPRAGGKDRMGGDAAVGRVLDARADRVGGPRRAVERPCPPGY